MSEHDRAHDRADDDRNLPPETTGASIQLAWPPIGFEEYHQTRGDHLGMFLIGVAATLIFVWAWGYGAAFAGLTGLYAGIAFQRWLAFDQMYDEVDDE